MFIAVVIILVPVLLKQRWRADLIGKLQQNVLRLQIRMYDVTPTMEKVKSLTHTFDHAFHGRDGNATIIERFDHAEEVASQHSEDHRHMPSVGTVVEERVVEGGNVTGVIDIVDRSDVVRITAHGALRDQRPLTLLALLGNAVQKFYLIHCRLSVVFSGLLHLEGEEEGLV